MGEFFETNSLGYRLHKMIFEKLNVNCMEKAERDAKTSLTTGAIVGAFTFEIVGAAVGASVDATVNPCKDEVAKAKCNVDRRDSDRHQTISACC